MKRIFPHIRKMSWEETSNSKLHNPGLVMEYGSFQNEVIVMEHCNLMIPLSAGYSDTIQIYQNGNSLMILITNQQLGYVGLDEVDCLDGDIIGTVFMQDYQLRESISKNWHLMKPETLIKRLSDLL